MSFDKMNSFVDDHTILMREFLRAISSNDNEPTSQMSKNEFTDSAYSQTTTSNTGDSLPPSPISSSNSSLDEQHPQNAQNSATPQQQQKPKELLFNFDLIDLGKQLSVLHTLLENVIASIPDQAKFKQLKEILNEISMLKSNRNSTIQIIRGSSSNLNVNSMPQKVEHSHSRQYLSPNVEENHEVPIHRTSPTSSNYKIAAAAQNEVNGVSNVIEDNLKRLSVELQHSLKIAPSPNNTRLLKMKKVRIY